MESTRKSGVTRIFQSDTNTLQKEGVAVFRRKQWPVDQHHLPILTSPECHVHPNYAAANGKTLQLICCSATQEFYDTAHPVEPDLIWSEQNTFYTTVAAIQKAMASFYGGRFAKL